MYGTNNDQQYRDSSADHIVQRRTARRVMFTDECSCDLWEEEIRRRRYSSSHVADGWGEHAHNSNNAASSCDCENAGNNVDDPSSGHHYQTPKEVDGDYSYAYSDSVSPAFLIRINASLQAGNNGHGISNMCGGGQSYNEEAENIYEEINEAVAMRRPQSADRNGAASGDSIRSLFQKAKESVRRTSKIMDESKDETDSTFHMSISKGRKKTLIDRAHIDWDNEETLKETLSVKGSNSNSSTKSTTEHSSKSSDGKNSQEASNSERENSVDTRETVTSTSPSGEDTQDDSGFHSGGIEEPNRRKKSKSQRNGKSRSESSDRLKSNISNNNNNNNKYQQQQSNNNQDQYNNKNGANSIIQDGVHMRENGGKSKESADHRSEVRRSRVMDMMQQPHSLPHMYPPHLPPHHIHHPHMMGHPPPSLPLPPPPPPPNHPQAQRKKSVLSRLVSPFLKGSHTSNNGPTPQTQNNGPPPPLQPTPQQLYAAPQQYLPPHHPHHIAVVPHYGPNNNIDKYHEEKGGRTFYL